MGFRFTKVEHTGSKVSAIKLIKMARQDLSVTETIAPDPTSKTQEAFDKIDGD